MSFAQYNYGTLTYSNERPNQMSADYYRVQTELKAYELEQKKLSFEEYCNKGFECFNSNDYNGCIYYYSLSKGLGWYNASFDYITGISYYRLGDFRKAKKLLKVSSRRGSYEAKKKLSEWFN